MGLGMSESEQETGNGIKKIFSGIVASGLANGFSCAHTLSMDSISESGFERRVER